MRIVGWSGLGFGWLGTCVCEYSNDDLWLDCLRVPFRWHCEVKQDSDNRWCYAFSLYTMHVRLDAVELGGKPISEVF